MATATGSSSDEPEDLFECVLCLGTLRNPQMLPCVHSFCSVCLEHLHSSDVIKGTLPSTQLKCPTCRQLHLLPPGGVKALPVDHRTNKMMSKWHYKPGTKSLICFLCMSAGQRTEALSYCFNCTFPICAECITKHKIHPMHRNHLTKTFSKEALDDVLCKIHLNEVLCFFCLDCSAAVCHICISNEHKVHKLTGYTSSENSSHQQGHKLKEQFCTIKDDITVKQSSLIEAKDLNDKCRVAAKDMIDKQADDHIKEIESQRRKLKESVSSYHAMVSDNITEANTAWSKHLLHVTKHIDDLNAMVSPLGMDNQLFPDGIIHLDGSHGAIRDMTSPAMISVVNWKFNRSLYMPKYNLGSVETHPVQLTGETEQQRTAQHHSMPYKTTKDKNSAESTGRRNNEGVFVECAHVAGRDRKLKVRGIGNLNYDVLEMFFESKKRSEGGDIRSISITEEEGTRIAEVEFEDEDVVSRLLRRPAPFALEGNKLTVEELPKPPQIDPQHCDQWSPLNPEGKKHYDRTFLLQLRFSTQSMQKPDGLPMLPDVVLDRPVSRNEKQFCQTQSSNSKMMLDFTPAYVVPNYFGSKAKSVVGKEVAQRRQ